MDGEYEIANIDQTDWAALKGRLIEAGCQVLMMPAVGGKIAHWNGALDSRPKMLVRCSTVAQVSSATRAASGFDAPLAVYNSGQDWNGRSMRDGSLLLDLCDLRTIEIDTGRREATIGAGVTSAQFNRAAGERGLAAVIGNDGAVSMAGLTLGGGYGPLMTRFGLACDNLLSAEVVLLDGSIVTCDGEREPDLFWALRGGGGNFGVVTSMRLRLHRLDDALVGTIVFPWTDGRAALAHYAGLMLRAPNELFGAAALSTGSGGKPVIVISLVWTGEQAAGEAIIGEVAAAGHPIVVRSDPTVARDLLSLTDGKLAQGLGYEVATRWFSALTGATIDVLLAAFEARTSPLTSIIVHHCHGAATQVAADVTAFGMRDPHFTALIYAAWEPALVDAELHRIWAASLDAELAPTSLPGGYANLLPDRASDRIAHAYGPNALRLSRIKTRFDSRGVLHAIPLPAFSRVA
ncbi:FAD-binding oxidoreductase [Paraburkholderia sp. BR10954]|uniref:FAD-binding oxidoreductase n=1 Tax=Paraburkholderia sp. BR10954 TaxID=3236995 RepID=UPI0034D1C9ED